MRTGQVHLEFQWNLCLYVHIWMLTRATGKHLNMNVDTQIPLELVHLTITRLSERLAGFKTHKKQEFNDVSMQ